MLQLHAVAFDEHHHRLIYPTDFTVPHGAVSLLQASTPMARTSLALICTGRMTPDEGEVTFWDEVQRKGRDEQEEPEDADEDQAADPATDADIDTDTTPEDQLELIPAPLRRRTALVDSPGITEPEHHMTVHHLVSESLALRPVFTQEPGHRHTRGARRKRINPTDWLDAQGLEQLAGLKVSTLEPETRMRLLVELSFADPSVHCAVLDSPDRHRIDPHHLLHLMQSLSGEAEHRSILVLLGHTPRHSSQIIAGTIGHAQEEGHTSEEDL